MSSTNLLATAAVLALGTAGSDPVQSSPDPHQILWQRSLEDAVAISAASGRPLLVAVNMDGETASDHIVAERYRDPAWVASTRPFVCVVASAFRHSLADYDASGERIPCPRLGEVTCGEHVALEPAVHASFLAGERVDLFGNSVERISPRHALIASDGTKTFDLFLLFDLRDLDGALAGEAAKWPGPCTEAANAPNSHRGRLAFEDEIAALQAPQMAGALLERIHYGMPGDSGWIPALRRLLPRASEAGPALLGLAEAADAPATRAAAILAVRERLFGAPDAPGEPGAGRDAALIPILGALAREGAAERTALLSLAALGDLRDEAPRARDALAAMFGEETASDVVRAIDASGGPFDTLAYFERARAGAPPPRAQRSAADEIPALEAALGALDAADRALAADQDDPERQMAFGRASLALARRHVADGQAKPETGLLVEDAERWLARASEARPLDARLLLERARAAYMRSRFDEQEALSLRALAALRAPWRGDDATALDDSAVEALRWLGDAAARQLVGRTSGGPIEEALGILRGGRALALAAVSRESDATDWLSLSTYFGALGRARERIAFAEEGVRRYPESDALRGELSGALWVVGRPDALAERSEEIARDLPDSAHSAWYAGYACILWAEQLRRAQRPLDAVGSYERAAAQFERALALEPSFRDSSEHYLALGAIGRGHALVAAGRRDEAARAALAAAALRPAIFDVRDGLDREGVDLVDGVLEWSAAGESPVDPLEWLDALERASPGRDFWARSISDAELREALRSLGREDRAAGERQVRWAVEAGRRAWRVHPESRDNARAFAQAATVLAEALLESGEASDLAEARGLLVEAAAAAGVPASDPGLDRGACAALAEELRRSLGARRPAFRPGR